MRYVAGRDYFRASVRIAVTLGALTGAPLCIGCSSDDDSNGDGGNLSTAGGTAGVVGAGGAAASSAGGVAGMAASAGTGGLGGSSASTGSGGSAGRSGVFGGETCMGLPPQSMSGSGSGGSGGSSPTGADAGATEGGAPDSSAGGSASGGASGGGSSDSGTCVGVSAGAESIPVDMYVMMDHSVSMNELIEVGGTVTRWDAVRSSVQQFVNAPEAAGVGVGIDFFPVVGGLVNATTNATNCDPDQYAMPEVGIGLLPGVGPAIVTAIETQSPRGLTPTIPAMRGAVQYAKSWATANPDRATIIVLVSDGLPTICPEGASAVEVAEVARDAYETDPQVLTFVIGLSNTAEGGSLQLNLDGIATAGGTGRAFLIQSGDVGQQFLDTILHIAKTPLSCEFRIPEPPTGSQQIDFNKVAVMYTPEGGETEEIPKVQYSTDCAASENGGFYYDNPATPTAIRICPCNCNRFAAGQVDIRLGCEPQLGSIQ